MGAAFDRTLSDRDSEAAAALWARSGAMALTGRRDGAPVVAPAALALAAERAAAELCRTAEQLGVALELDGPALFGERAALAGLSRALYFAGELDEAWLAASRAIEHPDSARRPPGYALARSTLALVAADQGRLASARGHAERARAIVGRITSCRSWLGANGAVALGTVLAGEGDLAGAEREFAYTERFYADEVATVHHAHLLVRLADVRCRRGRLDDADATLCRAHEAIAELADSGTVPPLAAQVERELEQARRQAGGGELLEGPSDAELAVLRLLTTDLSARQIAGELFLSPNTVRSHTRAIYQKLGVRSRADAVARADALGLLGKAGSRT